MPTFRYFVAVGVGATIALSCIESSTAKDLSAIAPLKRDRPERRESEPVKAPNPGLLRASPEDLQEVEAIADGKDESASATDKPETNSPEPSAEAREAGEECFSVDGRLVSKVPREESSFCLSSSPVSPTLPTDESKSAARDRAPVSQTLQNVSESVENDADKPVWRSSESEVAQSSQPETQQPQRPEAPASESLDPSANPLLFPTEAEEVQVQAVQPITLEQAIELAQRNNRELQTTRLNLERAQYDLDAALAERYPTGTLRSDFSRTDSAQQELNAGGESVIDQVRQLLGLPPTDDDDDTQTVSTTINTTLELSYDVYTAGRRPAQIRAAREQIRLQELEVERLSEQLRLNTSNAYYDLQEADAQVEIARAAVTDAQQSLRDAQLLEQAGLGTRFDVLQAEVQLANNNQDLTRSISQQQIARRQLVQLLSLAPWVEVSAADPIEVAGEWDPSLEQSIILAFRNRAELEQQLAQRNINEQQRRIQLAAIRPQASLFANYNILGVLDEDSDAADGFSLGARFQWNFFDGGAARARANQEEVDIAIAEQNFADQRNRIRFEVEQAFFNLRASAENIETASFALVQAQESLRLARLRFQAGVGTQTDVINQQTELTRARVNRLNAILDYNRALAALQRAVSNLPDSNLTDAT